MESLTNIVLILCVNKVPNHLGRCSVQIIKEIYEIHLEALTSSGIKDKVLMKLQALEFVQLGPCKTDAMYVE